MCTQTHTRTYKRAHMHIHTYTCTHMHSHVCIHAWSHMRTYIYMHACTRAHLYTCMRTCIHMLARIHTCMHIHVCMHLHTCTCMCAHTYDILASRPHSGTCCEAGRSYESRLLEWSTPPQPRTARGIWAAGPRSRKAHSHPWLAKPQSLAEGRVWGGLGHKGQGVLTVGTAAGRTEPSGQECLSVFPLGRALTDAESLSPSCPIPQTASGPVLDGTPCEVEPARQAALSQ